MNSELIRKDSSRLKEEGQGKFELWMREKLEHQIESLRLSKQEEINQTKIQVRNDTKREMHDYIHSMEHQFALYRLRYDEEFEEIRDSVSRKDRYIQFLIQYIFEQELLLSEFRLLGSPPFTEKDKSKDRESQEETGYLESSETKKQLKITLVQLESLKEICSEYKAEAEEANRKALELEKELLVAKEEHEVEMITIKNELLRTVQELQDRNQVISKEFNDYKTICDTEFFSREVIQNRQQGIITSLQDELRNAKNILLNPRLRDRLVQKTSETQPTQKSRILRRASVGNCKEIDENCAVKNAIRMRRKSTSSKEKPVFYISYRSPVERKLF